MSSDKKTFNSKSLICGYKCNIFGDCWVGTPIFYEGKLRSFVKLLLFVAWFRAFLRIPSVRGEVRQDQHGLVRILPPIRSILEELSKDHRP